MQVLSSATAAVRPLRSVVGRRSAAAASQHQQPNTRQIRRTAAAAVAQQEAALSSSGGAAGGAPAAAASLLQRLVAAGGLADRGTLLLAAALGGAVLLGAAEPAAAAEGSTHWAHTAAQPLGDLAENADFWGNVVRYISYFFSVLLGTAYIAVKPIIGLLKRPGTAVLVVAGLAGLVYFVSFTVQAMLGINEPIEYTASSIVTPQL